MLEVFQRIFPFTIHEDYENGLKIQRKERFTDQACTDSVIVDNLAIWRPPIVIDPSPAIKEMKNTIDCFHIGKFCSFTESLSSIKK